MEVITMAIDFPKTRDEAGITPGGPLEVDDQWYTSGKTYTVIGFNDEDEAIWFGLQSRRTNDPGLQEVLDAGNLATDSGGGTSSIVLQQTDGNTKESRLLPGNLILTDETSMTGPRVVFKSNTSAFSGRIAFKDSDRLVLETDHYEGVYVHDHYLNNEGETVDRKFRIEPNDREFAKGVYSITDTIFGGPTTITYDAGSTTPWGVVLENEYTFEDWSDAFNNALQSTPILGEGETLKDDYNGDIKVVFFPAGTYQLSKPVIKKIKCSMIGEGRGATRFKMEDRVNQGDDSVLVWRMPPTAITSDGMTLHGQFCLANKGGVRNISFTGHQNNGSKALAGDFNPVYDDDDEELDEVDETLPRYSTVLAFRAYDNNGDRFGAAQDGKPNIDDETGYTLNNQVDSADLDMKFVDCAFGSKGKGGDKDGCLKIVGRNALIAGCSFNSNHTGIVLTFPNRPGWDWTQYQLDKNGKTAPYSDTDVCGYNQSLSNANQGGINGWRRTQILGNTFHMNSKATNIIGYGKYQMTGMVIDGNLSDIGGRLLVWRSTGKGGSQSNEDAESNQYSNGVGGGMKNCVISNNSFGNQAVDGGYIYFESGRYDGNVITGNTLYGQDDSYKQTTCADQPTKRCRFAIRIRDHGTDIDGNERRGTVVRNLNISNNNFSYFRNDAIRIDCPKVDGLIVNDNIFYNIGCGNIDDNGLFSNGTPIAACVRINEDARFMLSNNWMTTEIQYENNDIDDDPLENGQQYAQNFYKLQDSDGNDSSNGLNSYQKVLNNIKSRVDPLYSKPGKECRGC